MSNMSEAFASPFFGIALSILAAHLVALAELTDVSGR